MTVAYAGIGVIILYFLVVAGYFITGTALMFRFWEVMIIISAPVMLLVIISVLENADKSKNGLKTAAIAFMTCTTAITAAAHYSDVISRDVITVGMQINDSLAWGLFMGLTFIFTSIALPSKISKMKMIKYTSMICGCLCLLGLLGPVLNVEALWFIAVAGYGIGTPVICIQLLSFYKNQEARK